MKKIYMLSILAAGILCGTALAQRVTPTVKAGLNVEAKAPRSTARTASAVSDTLTSHFQGQYALYTVDTGYMCGQNKYGDKAKMQLFDNVYGVTPYGTITDVLFTFGWVEGNPNSTITATIWANKVNTTNNADEPGNILGTVSIPYSGIDTSANGFIQIESALDTVFYNAVGHFNTPIAIPTSNKFWAGFSFNYAPGDTVALYTTSDGDFPDANVYTFEQWSDGTFSSFNDGTNLTWQSNVALAVFPVVSHNTGMNNLTPNNIRLLQNEPNPFNGNTTVKYELNSGGEVSLEITDILGKRVAVISEGMQTAGKHQIVINGESLNAGMYFYTLRAGNQSITKKMVIAE